MSLFRLLLSFLILCVSLTPLKPSATPLRPSATPLKPQLHHTGQHNLKVTLQPKKQFIQAQDNYQLPQQLVQQAQTQAITVSFKLHKQLTITNINHVYSPVLSDEDTLYQQYQITLDGQSTGQINISYEGKIHHPVTTASENYQRSFADTPGIIGPQGVYLDHDSYWYPHFNQGLLDYQLTVSLPEQWHSVSQGELTVKANNQKH